MYKGPVLPGMEKPTKIGPPPVQLSCAQLQEESGVGRGARGRGGRTSAFFVSGATRFAGAVMYGFGAALELLDAFLFSRSHCVSPPRELI